MRRSFSLVLACAATALTLAGPARALPEDRDQPIRIEADQALRDEKQGITRYEGNVVLDQGSLHIEADELTVYHENEDATKIEARGDPATMHQQPTLDKAVVHAHAELIQYFRDEERIQLLDNARIEQEGSTVTGNVINYYINQELVKAGSSSNDANSRVKTVIAAQAIQTAREENHDGNSHQPQVTDPNQPTPAAEPDLPQASDPNQPTPAAEPGLPQASDPNQPTPAAEPGPPEASDPDRPMPAADPNQPTAESTDGAADSQ